MSPLLRFLGMVMLCGWSGGLGCFSQEPATDAGAGPDSGGTGGGSSSGSGSGSSSGAGSSGSSGASGSSGGPVAGGPVDCTDVSTTTGTLSARFDGTELVAGAAKSYYHISNWWHSFANETEDYSGLSFVVHNPQNAAVPASDGNPMGFPSMFIGQYAGSTTAGSNLPKQVSAITSVPTIFATNNSTIGRSNHNATYDVWFTKDSAPLAANQSNPGAGGAYLMVWMFQPTDRQPRGRDTGRIGLTVNGVPGQWNVWVDTTNPPCISYVSASPIDGLSFDLNDFIQDAIAKQYGITTSMYLSIVFGGFEIWGNADGLALTQFCANVK